MYGPRKFRFYDPVTNTTICDDGHLHSPGKHRTPNAKQQNGGAGDGSGEPPLDEGNLFASFSDASGTAFKDMPIQPHLSSSNGGGGGGANGKGGGRENMYGLEGMDFSVHNGSSTLSEGPEVYGLRLENFDFDEQNLFAGFKPIFEYPAKEPEGGENSAALTQSRLEDLGIGKKNRPDMEMTQTIDLILS